MKISQIAAQLYTVRDYVQTPADIAASLKKVRAIGYEAVQLSGLGPIDEKELVKMLDGEGLVCCATHEPGDMILDNPEAVVERLNTLNCSITAYPYPAGINFGTLNDVKVFAARLNAAGEVLYNAGKTLCYHNHHIEFRRVGGKTILETLYEETDPRFLQGEPDTYWIQYGGGCTVSWCRYLAHRLPIIHYKDYMVTDDNQVTYAEIGNGNLDWPHITAAAEAGGCQWYAVEQDTCPGDPFDSLAKSFDYMKKNLC